MKAGAWIVHQSDERAFDGHWGASVSVPDGHSVLAIAMPPHLTKLFGEYMSAAKIDRHDRNRSIPLATVVPYEEWLDNELREKAIALGQFFADAKDREELARKAKAGGAA